MQTVFVVENSTSLVLAEPTSSLSQPLSPSVFVCLDWHCVVFMWVLAAAVVARRLLPKRFGKKKKPKKKNLFLSETNNRVT